MHKKEQQMWHPADRLRKPRTERASLSPESAGVELGGAGASTTAECVCRVESDTGCSGTFNRRNLTVVSVQNGGNAGEAVLTALPKLHPFVPLRIRHVVCGFRDAPPFCLPLNCAPGFHTKAAVLFFFHFLTGGSRNNGTRSGLPPFKMLFLFFFY